MCKLVSLLVLHDRGVAFDSAGAINFVILSSVQWLFMFHEDFVWKLDDFKYNVIQSCMRWWWIWWNIATCFLNLLMIRLRMKHDTITNETYFFIPTFSVLRVLFSSRSRFPVFSCMVSWRNTTRIRSSSLVTNTDYARLRIYVIPNPNKVLSDWRSEWVSQSVSQTKNSQLQSLSHKNQFSFLEAVFSIFDYPAVTIGIIEMMKTT